MCVCVRGTCECNCVEKDDGILRSHHIRRVCGTDVLIIKVDRRIFIDLRIKPKKKIQR